jgi:hypothetical protein
VLSQGDFVSYTWPELLVSIKHKAVETIQGRSAPIPILAGALMLYTLVMIVIFKVLGASRTLRAAWPRRQSPSCRFLLPDERVSATFRERGHCFQTCTWSRRPASAARITLSSSCSLGRNRSRRATSGYVPASPRRHRPDPVQ